MAKRPTRNDIEQGAGASIADIFGSGESERSLDPAPTRRRSKPRGGKKSQELAERYGKTPPWRLPPSLIEAVRTAADEHQVRPKDLVEYVLRVSLVGLATGKLQLPLDDGSTRHEVAPGPEIPDAYGT